MSQAVSRRLSPESNPSAPFLVLEENRFAREAIQQLANRPPSVRLVYLYGPSGVGKSHLTQYFLREQRRRSASIKVSQFTASTFAAELTEAAAEKQIPEFRQRYCHSDVILCEDLQALENRTLPQRHLRWLLDDVLSSGGRFVISCHRPVGELSGFLPRLANRMRGGLCAPIQLPNIDSRISLINHFAQRQQVPVSAQAARLLAQMLPVSPRELLAMVMQLDSYARMSKRPLDLSFVRGYLDNETKPAGVSVSDVASAVARHYQLRISEIRSLSRAQGLTLPRQCAMYLARQLSSESYSTIAAYFGGRRHSSAVHACNRIKQLLPNDPKIRQQLSQIQMLLNGTKRIR